MDEARRGGVNRRACCVVILEKGKPVETPGRKARGRRIEFFRFDVSPAAEGRRVAPVRRSEMNSRDGTQETYRLTFSV